MKNKTFLLSLLVVVVLSGTYFWMSKHFGSKGGVLLSPSPSFIEPTPTPIVTLSPTPKVSKVPLPTGDGATSFVGEPVPWRLLLDDASCELKGEIKFLNDHIYDNQNALFIYHGVDHPARNVKWTITPAEPNLSAGPNIFSKLSIPDGQSLLGIFPVDPVSAKKYTLTAVMQYGRLVDDKGKFVTVGGNVKVFEKPCRGQTTVVFP